MKQTVSICSIGIGTLVNKLIVSGEEIEVFGNMDSVENTLNVFFENC